MTFRQTYGDSGGQREADTANALIMQVVVVALILSSVLLLTAASIENNKHGTKSSTK